NPGPGPARRPWPNCASCGSRSAAASATVRPTWFWPGWARASSTTTPNTCAATSATGNASRAGCRATPRPETMHELLILRHAEAEPAPPGGTDLERILSDHGEAQAHATGQWLLAREALP